MKETQGKADARVVNELVRAKLTADGQPMRRARRHVSTAMSVAPDPGIRLEELQLAARNHGMPLEALRYPLTPVGLHYLLIHYDIPAVDPASWRLDDRGEGRAPASLRLEELRARPAVELTVTMECAGNGRARLGPASAQPAVARRGGGDGALARSAAAGAARGVRRRRRCRRGASSRASTAGSRMATSRTSQRSLPLAEALRDEVLLAYEINGQPLPPQHGFPLRLLVPGWYGMANVKWLAAITVVDRPFDGTQQLMSYRLRQDASEEGRPLTRMLPRALLVPPGIADFPTRSRTVAAGALSVGGTGVVGVGPDLGGRGLHRRRGELGAARIVRDLDSPVGLVPLDASTGSATPGAHELRCRARDAAGNAQPDDPIWNLGGYANNAVQRVAVVVR